MKKEKTFTAEEVRQIVSDITADQMDEILNYFRLLK